MICFYCESQNQETICDFCGADLTAVRPKIKDFLSDNDAFLPQPTLATYHTYDLLLLIRHLREERSKAYQLMQTVRRAPEEAEIDSGTITLAQDEYKEYTAHMRVIEGILIDRLGYKPKRVDDKLLESLRGKIEIG